VRFRIRDTRYGRWCKPCKEAVLVAIEPDLITRPRNYGEPVNRRHYPLRGKLYDQRNKGYLYLEWSDKDNTTYSMDLNPIYEIELTTIADILRLQAEVQDQISFVPTNDRLELVIGWEE
jgi:hypothetical protein